jgi:hypothetical protein
MKRKFHHYEKWEDFKNGMYENMQGRDRRIMLNRAITFMGNAELFGEFMMKVISEWPVSCEQNLTDKNTNNQPWIGQAACCMAIKCPEDVTREAWGFLSKQQQLEANEKADLAIKAWNEKQNNKIHSQVGKAGL